MVKEMQDKIDTNQEKYVDMMDMYKGFLGDDFEQEIEVLASQIPAADNDLDEIPEDGESEEGKEY